MIDLKGLDRIPEYCREELRLYIEEGLRPWNIFIVAVLTNDLFKAHAYAGVEDRIDDYITFLTKYAPPNCFGSRAKVKAWIEDATERRALAAMANIAGGEQK